MREASRTDATAVGDALRRRWWLPLVALLLGVSGGYLVHARSSVLYRATAIIRLTTSRPLLAGNDGAVASPDVSPVLSKLQVLRSRTVATRAARSEPGALLRARLAGIPWSAVDSLAVDAGVVETRVRLRFGPDGVLAQAEGEERSASYGAALRIAGVRLLVAARPSAAEATLDVRPIEQVVGAVARAVQARPRQGTDVVDVSYEAPDPVLAQRAVNAVVNAYEEEMYDQGRRRLLERVAFIQQQVRRTDSALRAAQNGLASFRSSQRAYNTRDDMAAARTGFRATDQRRRELDSERRLVRELLARAEMTEAPDRLAAIQSLAAALATGSVPDPVFDESYRRFTRLQTARDSMTRGPTARAATHPDVVQLDSVLTISGRRLIELARGRAAGLDARIGSLDRMVAHTEGELRSLPAVEEREVQLTSRADQLSRLADQLSGEYQRAQIAAAGEGGGVDVIDYASPGSSSAMPLERLLLLGGLLGALGGGAGAVVLDVKDRSIRRRTQISAHLGIPELAVIPRAEADAPRAPRLLPHRARSADEPAPLVPLADLRSPTAEAYRVLRTNLLYTTSGARQRTLAITSPLPRDGKTTVAANLAVAFASHRRRVLVIDGDLRRPSLHRLFGASRTPGLLDYLEGVHPLATLIRETAVPDLHLLPAGGQRAGSVTTAADALHEGQLRELLRVTCASYDIVILDCPPVLLTADAAVLAAHCDGVLLVARAGQTALDAGAQSLQQLHAVGARVVGAVLNDADGAAERYLPYGYVGTYTPVEA